MRDFHKTLKDLFQKAGYLSSEEGVSYVNHPSLQHRIGWLLEKIRIPLVLDGFPVRKSDPVTMVFTAIRTSTYEYAREFRYMYVLALLIPCGSYGRTVPECFVVREFGSLKELLREFHNLDRFAAVALRQHFNL